MNKRKVIVTVLSVLLGLAAVSFFFVYCLFLHHYHGKEIVAPWSADDPFDIAEIATVEKQAGKDFVILNLADVQLCDLEDMFRLGEMKEAITDLVRRTQPDLITLTGDQTWSNENLISLRALLSWLDSFRVPYAPVFGNHDYGNEKDSAVLSRNACCDMYEKGEYCLFKRGPSNLGTLGNYVVNITENGKIVKTLYMLDAGYESEITDSQISWVKWNAEGIRAANGGEFAAGMCFMHKPIPEYREAYVAYLYDEPSVEVIGDVYVTYSLAGTMQNGFFEAARSIGVTDIVCGHQHGNQFTLRYQGVRLTFAMKTGPKGGYYADEDITLDGATCFRLQGDSVTIQNVFAKEKEGE